MNHRHHQTLADKTPLANAPGVMKKTTRTFATFAIAGLFLCAGASPGACATFTHAPASASTPAPAPAQNTREIVPGLTVVFPAQPRPFSLFGTGGTSGTDRKDFWSATSTINGRPVRFIAGHMSLAAYGKLGAQTEQLIHIAPDYFAQMAPLTKGYLFKIDPKLQTKHQLSMTEVKRSPVTAGFPGVFYSWRNLPFPQDPPDSSSSPDVPKPPALTQFHGYVLLVNGKEVLLGLAQPDGTPPDSRTLERFVAAAHFPPAEKVGTLQDQLKAMSRFTASMANTASADDTADTADSTHATGSTDEDARPDQNDPGDSDDSGNSNDSGNQASSPE